MHYYGTRLSENISRREPEGYLLCLNVPVARTGSQDYLPEELGLDRSLSRRDSAPRSSLASADLSSDDTSATGGRQSFAQASFIPVLRPEAEVFSPETIASFEGMPVTNDHPPEGVDIGNIRALQKGHAHNVRRGTGEESDLLLADLIITDPGLIDLILEEGKREISCGYTYELCEENGQYIQRKIRGNHVAVVDAGRAGPRVSIKDEHPVQISDLGEPPATASGGCFAGGEVRRNKRAPLWGVAPIESAEYRCRDTGTRDWRAAGDDMMMSQRFSAGTNHIQRRAAVTIALNKTTISERSTPKMKKSLVKKLVRMAKDGDPEAIEAVAELLEEVSEAEVVETAAPDVVVVETPKGEEPATASGGNLAGSEVIRNEQAPQCGAATIENAENVVAIDEESFAGILERLDRIIELLTPAAADEDPVEEIVEAVVAEVAEGEEATTAGGGNLVGSEVNRNEQASQWEAATIEVAGMAEGTSPEEISGIVEEIVEPVLSETLEGESLSTAGGGYFERDEVIRNKRSPRCGAASIEDADSTPEETSAPDALRAALSAIRPALARMPKKQRRKVAADIAARMRKQSGRKTADGKTYAALAAASRRKSAAVDADLGKRIMASRNPNYRK